MLVSLHAGVLIDSGSLHHALGSSAPVLPLDAALRALDSGRRVSHLPSPSRRRGEESNSLPSGRLAGA